MQNDIKHLEINNFKSIKKLTIEPKRINLFIGKPNVGKSNILEALSMFCVPFAADKEKPLSAFMRFEQLDDLLHFKERNNIASVITDELVLQFKYLESHEYGLICLQKKHLIDNDYSIAFEDFSGILSNNNLHNLPPNNFFRLFLEDGKSLGGPQLPDYKYSIKRYEFNKLINTVQNHFKEFLLPPDGSNLTTILDSFNELRNDVSSFFEEYKLKLVRNRSTSRFEILRIDGDYIDVLPYSLIADTLQRIIFYIAAIETNKDSVLLFEEPESHNFPPYVVTFANRVIESKDNQFFITTHSPYLLQEIIENTSKDELAIYRTYYEDHQTKVELIDDAEFERLGGFGYNIFFNI